MNLKTRFMATGVGSMPFTDPEHAVDVSLSSMPSAPVWPQLPALGMNERMEIQYSEGMPCAVIDLEKSRLYFDTARDYSEAFADFYEKYMKAMDPETGDGDCSSFGLSEGYARGLHALLRRLKASGGTKPPFVKVQTCGPLSFTLTLTDENKRAIYYNEEFRDVLAKALEMKCCWQIRAFKPYAGTQVICFIDEPILAAFGSSTYVSVRREDAVSLLKQMADAVHAQGALAGVHCCGNTEWSILIDAGMDIINFDAFQFGDTIALYPEALKGFYGRGGLVAWGVVPTSVAIRDSSVEQLAGRLEKCVDLLASKGIDRQVILDQSMVTPSCGTGSLEAADAEMVFEKLAALSKALRAKWGAT